MVDADESGASVSFTKSLECGSGAVLWADKDAQTGVTQMKSRFPIEYIPRLGNERSRWRLQTFFPCLDLPKILGCPVVFGHLDSQGRRPNRSFDDFQIFAMHIVYRGRRRQEATRSEQCHDLIRDFNDFGCVSPSAIIGVYNLYLGSKTLSEFCAVSFRLGGRFLSVNSDAAQGLICTFSLRIGPHSFGRPR